jgi:hypothetical protein
MTLLKQISLFTEDKLTFSQEDSLVNPTQRQDYEKGKPMKDTSFRICLDALKRSNQDGLLAKMFVDLLIGMEGWYSTRCAMIWKGKAMKSNRFLFQLQVSTHHTKDTEFGLLLTPTTMEHVQDLDKFKERMEKYSNGTTMPNLATQIYSMMLPTPLASEGGKMSGSPTENQISLTKLARQGMLPTPAARDFSGAVKSGKRITKNGKIQNYGKQLPNIIQDLGGKPSQLNPLFVAEMMGFPENWTTLPFLNGETNQSKPMETQ